MVQTIEAVPRRATGRIPPHNLEAEESLLGAMLLSRDAIMDMLSHERLEAFDRSIDVHISRIRAAIEDDPKKPRRVITVRGAGYVFAKVQE